MEKLDEAGVEYIGRRLRLAGHGTAAPRILVGQEKYILEQVRKIPLSRGRRGDHSSPLVGTE
eukprot:6758301-Pyramimonas_sp.AAC.1